MTGAFEIVVDKITEAQLDGLRALCTSDFEKAKAVSAAMPSGPPRRAWSALLRAALAVAIHKRFGSSSDFEIMKFVAERRSVSERIADAIDPELAEAIILRVLGRGGPIDADNNTRYSAQLDILGWTLGDLKLRGEEMERFVAQAQRAADRHLAKLAAEQEGAG